MASLLKSFSKQSVSVAAETAKKPRRSRKSKSLTVEAPPPPPLPPPPKPGKKKKKPIPVALREQVWLKQMGRVFEGKCPTTWCTNNITVFDFQSGHNIPESKGGPTKLDNLIPLCSRCNLSMGNDYTFDQWCKVFEQGQKPVEPEKPKRSRFLCFWR